MASEATKLAERAVERISLTRSEAHNERGHSGHIHPREYERARERVAENEAKGYRLDGMPQSSIYGVRPRSEEEQRKARERAALMAAIADYKAEQKPVEPEQKPVEAEQSSFAEVMQRMEESEGVKAGKKRIKEIESGCVESLKAELMAFIEALWAEKKEEEQHAAGSNGEADDPGKPEGHAGTADDQAGADGVRPQAAGRDRERRNEDRGSAPATGPVRRDKRGKLTTAQIQEIYSRYMAGGVTQGQLAQEYGVSLNTVSVLVRKINAGGRVRGYDETKTGGKASTNAVWPALEKWRLEHNVTIEDMAKAANVNRNTLQSLWNGRYRNEKQQMEYGPRMSTIDKLLALTGMTYEEAFRRGNGK